MSAKPKPIRSAFLAEAAAGVLQKATVGGVESLDTDEAVFLRVWLAESAFERGGIDAVLADPMAGTPDEIASAYAAIGARRKADAYRRVGRIPAVERDALFDKARLLRREDADRLLERAWFACTEEARVERARRQGNPPGLIWTLICWTGAGWLVGLLFDQGCWLCLGVPLAGVAWIWWATKASQAAFLEARSATLGRKALIGLLVCVSITTQWFLFKSAVTPPSDAALQRRLQEHRPGFERLIAMVGEEEGRRPPDWTGGFVIDGRFDYRGGYWVSDVRLSEYRRLMTECGVTRLELRYQSIDFTVWRRGFIGPDSGSSKAIVYSEHPLPPSSDDVVYRRLEENWFVRSE